MLVAAGAALLLFAGGDGTAARHRAGRRPAVPIVGIPSGVKMRSGVFGASPEAAGDMAAEFLAPRTPVATADWSMCVEMDVGEVAAGRCGRRASRAAQLLGQASVPDLGGPGARPEELVLPGRRAPWSTRCAGPWPTTASRARSTCSARARRPARMLDALGLPSSPLGVDAVLDGALVGADLAEEEIVALMERAPGTRLVLGVIGGQGFLLGRGNQQLGPAVLSRLAPEDLIIIATADKLVALQPPVLLIDVGDEASFAWATVTAGSESAPTAS